MTGKVKQEDMENIVAENLEMMDTLLEKRKVKWERIKQKREIRNT